MNIGIIGLGLMGGSFGRTLVKKTNHTVYGFDINKEVLLKGEMLNAYHSVLTKENAKDLDMLIISVYPEYFESCLEEFLPRLKKGVIITDFCGTKRGVLEKMQDFSKIYKDVIFIGGHPMAGREFSGIDRSITTLFDKASMILVPLNADIFTLSAVKEFYLSLGFLEVVITTAENHDQMIAYTSQLCHIASNAFIKNKTAKQHFGYSAGSYKDLTRVARLNPQMWTGLMLENSDKLSLELDEYIKNLQKYSVALKNKDATTLNQLLKEGNDLKILIDSRSK